MPDSENKTSGEKTHLTFEQIGQLVEAENVIRRNRYAHLSDETLIAQFYGKNLNSSFNDGGEELLDELHERNWLYDSKNNVFMKQDNFHKCDFPSTQPVPR